MKNFTLLVVLAFLTATSSAAPVMVAEATMSCQVVDSERFVDVTVSWKGYSVKRGYFLATKDDHATVLDEASWELNKISKRGSHTETLVFNPTSNFGFVTWKLYDQAGNTLVGGELNAESFPDCPWL